MLRLSVLYQKNNKNISLSSLRLFSSAAKAKALPDFGVFPNEYEGNIYEVNWSLVEDGIVSQNHAFQNARLPLLISKLQKKAEAGKVILDAPLYFKEYNILESGDNLSADEFSNLFSSIESYFSSAKEIFVEDAGLGAFSKVRVGTRVTSCNPALSLIMRTLMVGIILFYRISLYSNILFPLYLCIYPLDSNSITSCRPSI